MTALHLAFLVLLVSATATPNAITSPEPLHPRATDNPATVSGVPTECITAASSPQWSSACQIDESLYDPPNSHNATYWCEYPDLNDENAVLDFWEGERMIGGYLDVLAYPNQTGWIERLVHDIIPASGDPDIAGCGTIQGGCNPPGQTTCQDMVAQGVGGGQAYWIFRSLAGFQTKLNIAEDYLQDATIDNLLSISDIASDFSAAPPSALPSTLASILSSAFFLVGGIGSVIGVAASEVGEAAAGALGALKGTGARLDGSVASDGADLGAEVNAWQKANPNYQVPLDAANSQAQAAKQVGRASGVGTASVYLVGSIFGTISSGVTISKTSDGTVSQGSLDDQLKALFEQARSNLQIIGRLATGRALSNETNAYSLLPGQNGTGTNSVDYESDIGAFFSDGRMLLGDDNPVFNNTLDTVFKFVKSKLVDSALQSASYRIVGRTDISNANDCVANYGAQWLQVPDGNTYYCFQMYQKQPGVSESWDPVPGSFYNTMQSKYGFNMDGYYIAAYNCNKHGPSNRLPAITAIPPAGPLPPCWYGIEAKKLSFSMACSATSQPHCPQPPGKPVWSNF